MKRRLQAAVFAAVAAYSVATAYADVVTTPRFPDRPTLAGDRAVWIQHSRSGRYVELWSGAPATASRFVQRFGFGHYDVPPRGFVQPSLAASSSLALTSVVATETELGSFRAEDDRYLGPPNGPLEQIAHCDTVVDIPRSADVWAEAYAYRACDDQEGHVAIRDVAAAPMSPPRSVGSGGAGARIAGRYVAWLDGPYEDPDRSTAVYPEPDDRIWDVVVYDRVADAEVYRISRAELPGRAESLDVQEDGKVAIVYHRTGDDPYPADLVVGWASPQDPRIHPLRLPVREGYTVRIGGDRIVFQGGDRTFGAVTQTADLGVASLDGGVRILARNTPATISISGESFDSDGERILWRQLTCRKWRLVLGALDAVPATPPATRCRLRLERRPTVRGGTATLEVDCRPFTAFCRSDVGLRLARGDGRSIGSATNARNPVEIKLTKYARQLLRARGALGVRAIADVSGDGYAAVGGFHRLRRSARITLQKD
jgi:hypothetical protein